MATRLFDLIVIGTGSAGLSALEAARDAGARSIAIVESGKRLGGECPNWGCVPSKSLLRSVEVLMLARRASEFGLKMDAPSFDFTAIMNRKQQIVDQLTGHERIEGVIQQFGATLIQGQAHFTNERTIKVGAQSYSARRFVIATGSETFVPPIPGLAQSGFATSNDIMGLKKLPHSLVIIGGGPIGVEVAQILAPLGTEVTIVEALDQLLPREDEDIAAVVKTSMEKQNVKLFLGTKVTSVKRTGRKFAIGVIKAKGGKPGEAGSGSARDEMLTADLVLLATGKRPSLKSLHLEDADIQRDQRGNPVLNAYLQTTNPKVYAAGDVTGQMAFTHVAHLQGEVAAQNATNGNKRTIDLSVIPRGTFCSPEVGSVGLTEAEAKQRGFNVAVGKVPYSYFGKALVTGEMEGLIKIVVDKKTKLILGGHIVGEDAAELVHEIALAMYAKIPYTTVANMVHAYPTFAEAVGAAASNVS